MKLYVALSSILFLVAACGPMNKRPTDKNVAALQEQAKGKIAFAVDKDASYVLFAAFDGPKPKPSVGQNIYEFRIYKLPAGKAISADSKITASLMRKGAKAGTKPKELTLIKDSDGSVKTEIAVKKAGEWDVTFTIQEPGGQPVEVMYAVQI